jgi:ubiquinone/menaquinone biosynthesis C-methylase UbiE
MSQLTGDERASYVHNIFGHLAKRYNLMNRLMTAGQDIR